MFHIGVATKHPPLPEPNQLSQLGIRFIDACLVLDPVLRPSAEQLMDHPWLVSFRDMLEEYDKSWLLKLGLIRNPEPLSSSSTSRPNFNGLPIDNANGSLGPTESFFNATRGHVRRDTVELLERVVSVVRRRRSIKAIEAFEQARFLAEFGAG